MPLLLLISFGLYGWIEFEAFIAVGNAVGGLLTFLGIFLTAFVGVFLLKTQSGHALRLWQISLSKGEVSQSALASGLSLILGAFLMLIPGYVTDLAGLLCFMPGLRILIGQAMLRAMGPNILSSLFSARVVNPQDFPGGFNRPEETDHDTGPTQNTDPKSLDGEIIEGRYETKDRE